MFNIDRNLNDNLPKFKSPSAMEHPGLKKLPPTQELGFGLHYAPLMMISEYKNGAWSPLRIEGIRNLEFHPGARCLHYAQEIFEGLKAYKNSKTGKIHLWRPEFNIRRMSQSAEKMIMPVFPENEFLTGMKKLVMESKDFVPDEPGALYLRPTQIGISTNLGVGPAKEYLFYIVASPVGGYFGGLKEGEPASIKLWVSPHMVRACPGGLGSAKTGANYAASLPALHLAKSKGYANVLFLDAILKRNIEELSGMNFFVVEDGVLKTAPLGDTILRGCTRDSILEIARSKGITAREEVLPIDRIIAGIESGKVSEAFACGTGASITSIESLDWNDKIYNLGTSGPGKITRALYQQLLGEQFGKSTPTHSEWVVGC